MPRERLPTVAFTLLELATVVVVVSIIAVLMIAAVAKLRQRAQRVQCTGNLRSLHVAAALAVQEEGMWPQVAISAADDASAQEYARAWIDALRPHGGNEKTWICPTMQNELGNPDYLDGANVRVDYIGMSFDDKSTTPHNWPRHPWFLERGNMHGNGNLVIFTDGSVSDLKSIAAQAKEPQR
ncbi:hypothetical protein BH20VER2_BH20VER2_11480 [soil metagenome]|nr:hypothetical protein [Chthoniobacterales bacterium]